MSLSAFGSASLISSVACLGSNGRSQERPLPGEGAASLALTAVSRPNTLWASDVIAPQSMACHRSASRRGERASEPRAPRSRVLKDELLSWRSATTH